MSTKARAWARRYIECGYAPIPVPAGSKNPSREDWQNERHGLEDVDRVWSNGQGIGLLTGAASGWLVDVDLDAPEAVSAAGRFLRPTRTSGHGEALDSHWWYFAEGTETKMFYDTEGKKRLVELRAGGCQTIVAPSVHPGGDQCGWNAALEVEPVAASELRRDVNRLATATLIARHLPEHRKLGGGGRHDYALALAGFMLKDERLDRETVLGILLAAWDAKGWPSEQDRREAHRDLENAVEDTVQKLGRGEKVKGGRRLEEMERGLPARIADYWGWSGRDRGGGDPDEKEERRNQADRLIGYALEELLELFVDQHGAPHVLVAGEPLPLGSRCYPWLRRLMWEREGRSVTGEALKAAAGTLAAHAEFSGLERELYTRAAWYDGALYYELRPGRVVKVDAGGWDFEPDPPVLFRHFSNLKPLPDPECGGSLDELDELTNLRSERDRRLFKAHTATVPLEHVGRPILQPTGAMGSGKTTLCRIQKRLLDPTAPETVRLDPRDFLQKASHCFIVSLDNQSQLPEWGADTLCRLVTGEADSKRRNYTDDEDFIYELRRAVHLNGINPPSDRPDLLDRALALELERIPDVKRKAEEELWKTFESEHPKLLGAIFDALGQAMSLKLTLELSRRPRLADWGEFAAAVYEAMGWEGGKKTGAELFLEDWGEVVNTQNQATLDGSPVALTIIRFMSNKTLYQDSPANLHKELEATAENLNLDTKRDRAWPKSSSWLWRRIKEVIPLLLAQGITAERGRGDDRTITLRKDPENAGGADGKGECSSDKPKSPVSRGDHTDVGADGNGIGADGDTRSTVSSEGPSVGKEADTDGDADGAERITYGESGNPVSTVTTLGDSSDGTRLREFLEDPPEWFRKQAETIPPEMPERLLGPLAKAVSTHVFGSPWRWQEVLLAVEEKLKEMA